MSITKRQVEDNWGLTCYDGHVEENYDMVNRPQHYIGDNIEVIDVIEAFNLSYKEGNVLKYLLRWQKKGGIQDLRKAQWYLNRLINEVDKN